MGQRFDLDSAGSTDFTNTMDDYEVYAATLDSADKFNEYQTNFSKWNGYFKAIPEARSIIKTMEKWVLGKGCKGKDLKKLERISGNGKENFLKVFRNIWAQSKIGGDGFGEIIRDNSNKILNLKALNPDQIRVVYNGSGQIIAYSQYLNNDRARTWRPEQILHIQNERIGDEALGHSLFESIEQLILNRNEVIDDLKTLFHRFVKPVRIFEANTDKETKLRAIETKINTAHKNTENIVIPKGSLALMKTEIVSTQVGGLSPLEYYRLLIRTFITSCGVPEIIMGWGENTTEASAKILYLSWEQTIEDEQKKSEDDLKIQMNVEVNFEFPISIEQKLMQDEKKDKQNGTKKSEVSVGNEQERNNIQHSE